MLIDCLRPQCLKVNWQEEIHLGIVPSHLQCSLSSGSHRASKISPQWATSFTHIKCKYFLSSWTKRVQYYFHTQDPYDFARWTMLSPLVIPTRSCSSGTHTFSWRAHLLTTDVSFHLHSSHSVASPYPISFPFMALASTFGDIVTPFNKSSLNPLLSLYTFLIY